MKVIARPRGTKKSWELLKACSDNNGVVLTMNKRALQVKAESYGFNNIEIVDVNDVCTGSDKPLYIYKADELLEALMADCGYKLEGIMVTTEE